jgi:hypothetical protein
MEDDTQVDKYKLMDVNDMDEREQIASGPFIPKWSYQNRVKAIRNKIVFKSNYLLDEERERLMKILFRANKVFSVEDGESGWCWILKCDVNTGSSPPISVKPRRMAPLMRPIVEEQVQKYLDGGIVRESCSPWSSPIVMVRKKNGEWRMCIDFRDLNKVTCKDPYPIPRCDELLQGGHKGKYFTALDFDQAYHQILVTPRSREKLSFVCHSGQYEFLKMPFGITNGPAIYQRMINKLIQGMDPDKVFAYIDDIMIATETFEEHLELIAELFKRLERAGLKIKPQKCEFAAPEVHYLGHKVGMEGNHTS